MRRLIDTICPQCKRETVDVWLVDQEYPTCECGGVTERLWRASGSAGVIGDDIPGGIWIKHGICNPDGTPKRYDSKTDIRKAEKATGWSNHVTHVPLPGTDKSKFTTRWV